MVRLLCFLSFWRCSIVFLQCFLSCLLPCCWCFCPRSMFTADAWRCDGTFSYLSFSSLCLCQVHRSRWATQPRIWKKNETCQSGSIRHLDAITENSGIETNTTRKPLAHTDTCYVPQTTAIRGEFSSSTFVCPLIWKLATKPAGTLIFTTATWSSFHFRIWRWDQHPFLTPYTRLKHLNRRHSIQDWWWQPLVWDWNLVPSQEVQGTFLFPNMPRNFFLITCARWSSELPFSQVHQLTRLGLK